MGNNTKESCEEKRQRAASNSEQQTKNVLQVTPYSFGSHSKSIYTSQALPDSIFGGFSPLDSIRQEIDKRMSSRMPTFSGFDINGSVYFPKGWNQDEGDTPADELQTDYQRRRAEKEARKQEIIQRTRNAPLHNEYFHEGQPTPSINDPGKKRVAVYTRVSTKSVNQVSSLENQEKAYLKKIDSTPNWELVEVYSDKGISGVNITKRKAFQKMLQDAAKGAFDYILCTSVSRFSRNISQCLEAVGQLRQANPKHPVGVFFETENIFTLNPDSSQAFGIHALLAHWESENRSKRMILSMDQRIMIGDYQIVDLFGYRHTRKRELIIQKEEAIVFRYIVLSLIIGKSGSDIAQTLTEKRKMTLTGNTNWTSQTIRGLLLNERRWGDLEARKTICTNYIDKTTAKNNGVRDWAYVADHHQGIVTENEVIAARLMFSASGMLEDGMPELRVIRQGCLRGFVSIRPRWNGINTQALFQACFSAYSEEEVSELQEELQLWSRQVEGEEDVTKPIYQSAPGLRVLNHDSPKLTVFKRSLALNSQCHKQLNTEWAEFLYHPIRHMLLIRNGSPNDPNSIRLDVTGQTQFCAEATVFTEMLYKTLCWRKEHDYCFKGIIRARGKSRALIFSMDAPIIASSADEQHGKRLSLHTRQSSPTDAIYTNHAEDDPMWNRRVDGLRGRNQILNHKQVIQNLTEADLDAVGDVLINPAIGSIESRENMLNEIQELLEAM